MMIEFILTCLKLKVDSSVGSGPEIFGLGLTVLPNVRARALSGLLKCEMFGLGLGGSGLSGLSGSVLLTNLL